MDQFDVYVAGFEVEEARAARGLMQVFGMSEAAARIFVSSVPRVAKRRLAKDTAERYVRALRSIGAIIDLHPSTTSYAPPSGQPSLPTPQRALRTSGRGSSEREGAATNPFHPAIPRAPRLPEGLMPTAASSEFPADLAPSSHELLQATAHARLSSPLPPHDPVSMRPEQTGVFNSHAPLRPGVSHRPVFALAVRWYERRLNQLVLLSLLLGAAFVAYSKGVFRRDDSLEQVWQRAGINPGTYDDAHHFIDQPGDLLSDLAGERARSLLDGLERAGAKHVWAIEIVGRGPQKVAKALLVDLPANAAERQTIFWQHARSVAKAPVPADTGQALLRIGL